MNIPEKLRDLRVRFERRFRLSGAYREVFGADPNTRTMAQDVVIDDLNRFCGGTKPPARADHNGRGDPLLTGIAIGRQEVFFRLQEHLHIDEQRLFQLQKQQITEASDA